MMIVLVFFNILSCFLSCVGYHIFFDCYHSSWPFCLTVYCPARYSFCTEITLVHHMDLLTSCFNYLITSFVSLPFKAPMIYAVPVISVLAVDTSFFTLFVVLLLLSLH